MRLKVEDQTKRQRELVAFFCRITYMRWTCKAAALVTKIAARIGATEVRFRQEPGKCVGSKCSNDLGLKPDGAA